MIFIPFVFFLLLTIYFWKKHRYIDICVYMSSLYAFTTFCAIPLVLFDMLGDGGILFDETDIELNILPTLLFCLTIGLSIMPFSMVYTKEIKEITPPMPFVLEGVSWFLIAVSVLNLYIVADSTLDILQGNLEAVREAHYSGVMTPAAIKVSSMPFLVQFMYYFNISTLLCLPIFFYHLCFDKKPMWYLALLFFASLSNPIAGIQAVDRTEIMFYSMMFLLCLLFFFPHLSKKVRRITTICSVSFAIIIFIYVFAVSQARFSERSGGAETSALQYTGQGYLNFCYFWENGKFEELSTEREFAFLNHYLLKIDSNSDRRSERSGKEGFFISVFPTFVGDILLDLTPIGMFIWISIYFIICIIIIQRPRRSVFSIGEILMLFCLSITPIFGIFYYKLFYYTHTLMEFICVFVYVFSKIRIKI